MNRLILLVLAHVITIVFGSSESLETETESAEFSLDSKPDPVYVTQLVEKAIAKIESIVAKAAKLTREGILPPEETEKHYKDMIEILADVTEIVKDPGNAHRFIKAKGIDRIIFPYMDIEPSKLRVPLLELLKVLFEKVPKSTDAVIPISTIDKLLDIFENDHNLSTKAHVLDIFYIWLPENPKAQLRIMKLKGLEPFYEQITKLDISVIEKLLYLFNKILDEHIKARDDTAQRSQADSDRLQLYQQAGLIERMSTPRVCNGLFNVFQDTWPYVKQDHDVIGPVLDLVKNIKPYCIQTFKKRHGSKDLFTALLTYVEDSTKKGFLETLNLNVTNIKAVVEDYLEEFKRRVRDEF